MNIDDILNNLLNEKQANVESGNMDVVWINGENFFTANKMTYCLDLLLTSFQTSINMLTQRLLRLTTIDEIESNLDKLPKEKTIALYCSTGTKSAEVAKLLEDIGYGNIVNSIEGVKEYSFTLEK